MKRLNLGNINELAAALTAASIDVKLFGQGKAKELEDLFEEVRSGETILEQVGDGALRRVVTVAKAEVRYGDLRLREEKQTFKGDRLGQSRSRWGELAPFAVQEKFLPGEEPATALRRALAEELSIAEDGVTSVTHLRDWEEGINSPSYPGLKTVYRLHGYRVELAEASFHAGGYVEAQTKKDTFFVWEKKAVRWEIRLQSHRGREEVYTFSSEQEAADQAEELVGKYPAARLEVTQPPTPTTVWVRA